MAKIINTHPKLTPAKLAAVRAARKAIDINALQARGRAHFAEHESITRLVQELRAARVEQDVTLDVLAKRCGIAKASLSRLENGQTPNPTLDTLNRVAAALGRRVELSLH